MGRGGGEAKTPVISADHDTHLWESETKGQRECFSRWSGRIGMGVEGIRVCRKGKPRDFDIVQDDTEVSASKTFEKSFFKWG